MSDEVIHTGCSLRLTCVPPLVVPALLAPIPMVGSCVAATVSGHPFCVEGDELPMALRAPLAYSALPFLIPGRGRLVLMLRSEHWARSSSVNGRRYLRRGPRFHARFEVLTPAMQPTAAGPVPDAASFHMLHGVYLPLAHAVTSQ